MGQSLICDLHEFPCGQTQLKMKNAWLYVYIYATTCSFTDLACAVFTSEEDSTVSWFPSESAVSAADCPWHCSEESCYPCCSLTESDATAPSIPVYTIKTSMLKYQWSLPFSSRGVQWSWESQDNYRPGKIPGNISTTSAISVLIDDISYFFLYLLNFRMLFALVMHRLSTQITILYIDVNERFRPTQASTQLSVI